VTPGTGIRCSVVVPVHGSPGVAARCLDAVLATVPDDTEVIVVDDGSPAGTAEALARFDGRVDLVAHRTAAGYATACNAGAAASRGRLLVFLNSDTVPQAGWLDALVREADRRPEAAVVGSRLLFPDGTIQHAGVVVCGDRIPRHAYRGFPGDHPAVIRSRRLQIVTGACMLVRREPFEAVGGFDAAFRNGYEDVDLCLRLGLDGHQVRYCADSVVVHLESVSLVRRNPRARTDEIAHNLRLYRRRWADRVEPDDLATYAEDGLLAFEYAGDRRPRARISPLLAELDGRARAAELERVADLRDRQVGELLGDVVDLTVAVAEAEPIQPAASPDEPPSTGRCDRVALDDELMHQVHELQLAIARRRPVATDALPSRRLAYSALRRRIRASIADAVPAGSVVLVASRGDDELLELEGVDSRHFPQAADGAYAGHHPLSAAGAIDELEAHRRGGAEFFLLPETMRWWLEHYVEFARHLERYERLVVGDACDIYALEPR
jgi:GT2 family glycosyltransferase